MSYGRNVKSCRFSLSANAAASPMPAVRARSGYETGEEVKKMSRSYFSSSVRSPFGMLIHCRHSTSARLSFFWFLSHAFSLSFPLSISLALPLRLLSRPQRASAVPFWFALFAVPSLPHPGINNTQDIPRFRTSLTINSKRKPGPGSPFSRQDSRLHSGRASGGARVNSFIYVEGNADRVRFQISRKKTLSR